MLCYNSVYYVTKLDFNTLVLRCYSFSKVVFLTGVILLCPKSTIVNLDLKIDYRSVGDKIMISLTTFLNIKGRGPTDLAMTQPSLKGSIVSFRRAFGDAHQANFPFTEQLLRTLILGEQLWPKVSTLVNCLDS